MRTLKKQLTEFSDISPRKITKKNSILFQDSVPFLQK